MKNRLMCFVVGAALVVAVAASLPAQTPQLGAIQFPTSATGRRRALSPASSTSAETARGGANAR
jgi:hypothetical protein